MQEPIIRRVVGWARHCALLSGRCGSLVLGRHGSSVAAEAGVAPGAPQSNAAATDALELTQQLLARANRLEQERKLEEAFETAREASRTLQSATGLAELGRRLYLQGTIESLFGKIFAENPRDEQAIASWNDALSSYAPLYNADAEFWRRASQPGSPFKDAAANITVTLDFMAQVYELQKKPEEALKQLGLETALLEKIDDDEKVLECRRRSLKVIEANPSLRFAERRRAQMLMAIGVALTNVGRPGEALPLLEQASTILSPVPRTPDPELAPARVNARLFTGYTLQALGRDSEALPILRSAAADLTAGGADETEQLRALERVFVSLYRLGQFAEAMDVLKQRIDLAHRTSGMEAREFAARIHLTLVHYQLGDYPAAKAESADLKRLAVNTKIPLEDRVRAYANDGVINRDAKDFRAAADSFGAAIGLLETEPGTEAQRARYHIDVAKALSALRRPDDARAALERGLRLVDGDADHAVVAAELRRSIASDDEGRLGKPGAVARQCQQIISTLSKTPSADELMLRCLVDIGRDHQQAGRADDAIAAFRNAADRLSPAGENAVSVTELGGNSDKQHQRWVVMTGLGLALAAAGRTREAAVQLIAASELARNRIGTGLTAVPILTRYRLMAADTRYAAAGRIAVALSFQSPDVDVVRSFEMAIGQGALHRSQPPTDAGTARSRRPRSGADEAVRRSPAASRTTRHRLAAQRWHPWDR